jgi:circadian clock protein KaiB
MKQVSSSPTVQPADVGAATGLYRFRLYVAGSLPNSQQARQNLQALCEAHLPDRHEIEVVDFLEEPTRGLDDGVIVTPTLVLLSPGPARTVVGSLADRDAVLRALELPPEP